jgi:hypothetical protein
MNEKLEKELVVKYPKILQDYKGDMKQTCMCWGLECDDGWYDLLDKCMSKLQYFCDICSEKSGKEVQVIATQIKEKFGTLRFYIKTHGANDIENKIIDDIIDKAESDSAHICEITGKDANVCHRGGWYKTLSYKEARERGFVACNEDVEKYWKRKDAETDNE